MKRFSFATGLACSCVMAATVIAQTAASSTRVQSRDEVQVGQAKVSADAKQEADVRGQRKGRTIETNADSQAQSNANVQTGNSSLNLDAGTQLQAVLKSTLDSKQAEAGQPFLLKTTKDVKAGGRRVIKKGATLVGQVVTAQSKAEGQGQAGLTLMITGVQQGEQVIPLQAIFVGMIQPTLQTGVDSDLSTPTRPAPARSSGGGGLLGGGGLVGGATGAVNGTLGATTQTVGNIGGSTTGVNGTLANTTNGTLAATGGVNSGLLNEPGRVLFSLENGLTATSTVSGATAFRRAGKEVKLEKGTEFVLAITGNSRTSANSDR